jgi:hypothetical protein
MRSYKPPFWIGDRLFGAEDLALIEGTVKQFRRLSRTELAATICEILPWKAPNGKLKLQACLLLLEGLAASGLIELPAKRGRPAKAAAYDHGVEPLPCVAVEGQLKEFRPVTVDPVSLEEHRLWNATMSAYHPLGYRHPFGAHQRYWIHSRAGGRVQVLGAMLFAAAARTVADREAWIRWTALERDRFRCRIVNQSRFLVLPGVKIPHLASHVLALVSRRIRADWVGRYGYAPVLLETFVTPPHRGTCYRAANWYYIGETAGSGREPRAKKKRTAIKMLFMYPLVRNWRAELCAPLPAADEEGGFDA